MNLSLDKATPIGPTEMGEFHGQTLRDRNERQQKRNNKAEWEHLVGDRVNWHVVASLLMIPLLSSRIPALFQQPPLLNATLRFVLRSLRIQTQRR